MNRLIKNFMKYRFLLVELVKKDIKLKYRRSVLGILWTLLEPLLTMIVLTLVFSNILGRGGKDYPVYILTGRLLYGFFATSTKAAMKSIRSNAGMIKKVYVPKYIYPLSCIISNYITFLISLIVLLGVSVILQVKPSFHIIEAIIPLLVIFIMALGVGMILATLAVFFRDLEYLWGVVLMLIMYTSAIFYHVDDKLLDSKNSWLFDVNPLYNCIVTFRDAVLYGQNINLNALAVSGGFALVSVVIGFAFFYKQQDKFILNI